MKYFRILAQATDAGGEGEVITMEESGKSEQATTSQDGSNGAKEDVQPRSQQNPLMTFLPLILIFAVMYLFMFRGPKKKQQEHQKMVQSLSKNDRVRTIGGIYGTVLDVRDDEIVLKIDESTNTKMRINPQAIAAVLTEKNES